MAWIGNVLGDIKIENVNIRFYFTISSRLILSIALTILINILSRFFK